MSKILRVIVLSCFFCAALVFGQNYSGTYVSSYQGVTATLVLLQDAQGKITGTLSSTNGKGAQFRIEGTLEEGRAVGLCHSEDGTVYFEAELHGDKLRFSMFDVGENNNPDYSKAKNLEFVRQGAGTKAAQAGGTSSAQPPANPPQNQAQGTQQLKGGAKAINDPQMGISFTPPAGWKAQKQASGYLLGSDTYRGLIIIMPHNYSSLQQMNAEAQEGIVDEGSGIQLQPVSGFQTVGKNGLAGEFSGMFQGQIARAFAIGLISPSGGGVTIMAAVESGSYTKDYPRFVQTLAAGLSFIKAQPQGQGQGPGDSSLMNYFAGKYYSYSSGSTISGGAGTERQLMLCPNGQFYDSYEFSASGSDWGGANSRQGAARWRIQGSKSQGIITIIRPDGRTEQVPYQVTGEDGVIFFNGIKFAYAGAPECR